MLDQDVVAIVEGFRDVHTGDRPARALPLETVDGDHRRRPPVILHEPRRAQADDARGPGGIGDHRRPRIRSLLGALTRTSHDEPGQLLPLGVALLQPLRELLRLGGIFREQQTERVLGIVDATGGVETRTEDEPDLGRTDPSELQPAPINECANANEWGAVQRFEPRPSQHAIRVAQRNDVGHRRTSRGR